MKRLKCALAVAALLMGALVPDVASADRRRGGDAFQPRHEAFKFRHDAFRSRDDFFRPQGRTFSHRRDVFRHGDRVVPARRGHGGHRSHSHTRFGLHIGVPLYWNWPPPYYAYPPTVITVPSQPQVYIERGYDEPAPARGQGYWYYCDSPSGYYPYVRECPGGWQPVSPTPPR